MTEQYRLSQIQELELDNLNNEEINRLLNRQLRQDVHPYTCPNSHGALYPTVDRWVCGKCNYFQLYGNIEMRVIGRLPDF